MFSALKYHAIDYLYEKVARQRFSFELFSIHIPSGLYKDQNYYHNGHLADDTYRRPWTRVTPDLTQIDMDCPVLDIWNKYLYTEDFLEEKPTSSTLFHVHNEDIEIVPSSNPGSPFDIEDAYVLMKNEDSYLHPKYAPKQEEGFYIEDELDFTDYLAQYPKRLPTSHMLLSRINKFHVQEPFSVQELLLNDNGDKITEEDIFRECFAFKMNVTSEAKGKAHQDDFRKVSLKNEELQYFIAKNLGIDSEILTCLALNSSEIQEIIGNENENLKITNEDLEVKITPETENLEYCPPQKLCASQSRSVLELSRPEHPTSVPKCQQLSAIEFEPGDLPGGNTPMGETAEGNSSLACDHAGLAGQEGGREQRSATDAHQGSSERPLSAHEDILVFSHLEKDDCINLKETCTRPCVLEELNTDLSAGDEVLHTNVEVVSKISTSQMDKCLEETSSFANNRMESSGVPDCSGTKDSCLSPQKKEGLLPVLLEPASGVDLQHPTSSVGDKSAPTEENIRKIKRQTEIRKPGHFGNLGEANDQVQLVSSKEAFTEAKNALGNNMPAGFDMPGFENENLKITSKDHEVKIMLETENLEYCPPQELCASQSGSVLEPSRPEHPTSVPKCQQLSAIEFEPDDLPGSNTPMGEMAEGNSPLACDHAGLLGREGGREQRSATDAHRESGECPLSAHEDILVFSHLEKDDCINLKETCARPCVLEKLNTDLSAGDEVLHTNVEVVSKISTSQMDKCLEETSSFSNNRMESSSVIDCSGTKDSYLSPQKKEGFLPVLLEPASGVDLQHPTFSVGDKSVPTEENIRKMKQQTEIRKPGHFGNPGEANDQVQLVSSKEAFTEAKNALENNMPGGFDLPRKCRDDFDLLSNFIMLRSQHMIIQKEEPNDVDIQAEVLDAKEKNPTLENNISPLTLNETVPMEKQTKENEEIVSIQIKASESQFQAYHILEAAVTPVLKELMNFCMHDWKFLTLNFDTTRYFLKQQEKVISDAFKQGVTGIKEGREIAVFKHAVTLHLLVTVRDLLLTCNLNTALGYLFNAKDRYKDFLDSRLDNICRLLEIVQISMQNYDVSPKIKELYHQMCKWVQSNMNDQNKVVIVTRMGFDEETEVLINTISTVQGLKIVYLDSEERGTFLESKDVISSLERYSCVVVYNQNIGPDFPWTHFSLVVEYNYSEKSCWLDICRNLNVSYITLITTVPETFGIEEVSPDNFGCVLLELPIPYVFLTTEGLLSTPEILQLLESKYNITFIERNSCEALQFFGSTDRYIVITVDECTAILIQNMEELGYEKSSDNIVLRLVVLSLQYSSCWIILYSQERLNSEYTLAGKTLHHLTLIYAALVSFAQKSEDFEVKVVLTPGVAETALLVRQIADHSLMTSQRHPQEWLDKSWLSVLPSEEEKSLLSFPCMNPLVAQVMLKKSSSLEWLLSATFDQLHALLPEVPGKVLKHFSDITSLYILNPPAEPKLPEETMSLQKNIKGPISSCSEIPFPKAVLSGFQGHSSFTEYFENYGEVQNSKNCFPVYYQNESYTPLKSGGKHSSLMAPSVPYQEKVCSFQDNTVIERQQYTPFAKKMEVEKRTTSSLLPPDDLKGPPHINFKATMPYLVYNLGGTNTYLENGAQNKMYRSKAAGQKLDIPIFLQNLAHQNIENVLEVKKQPLVKQCKSIKDSKSSWHLVSSREDSPIQRSSQSFLGELGATGYSGPKFKFEEMFWGNQSSLLAMDSSPHDSSFSKALSSPDRFFNLDFPITGEYTRKKSPNVLLSNRRECVSAAGLECTQLPQLKKRRLTYEKDPGRSDGQTRLKFL